MQVAFLGSNKILQF